MAKQIAHIGIAGVRVAFLKVGETRIELLEPLHEKSAIKGFLEKRGEGIHHIAFEIDDIDGRLETLKNQGMRLVNEEAKDGAHNSRIAFIHPKESNGVLVELCEQTKGSIQ